MTTKSAYKYIVLDEDGVPQIVGANTKVVEVVLDKIAYGWSAEEMHYQHPHLSLAQIHSALAYYWDHKAEMDADIEARLRMTEEIRAKNMANKFSNKIDLK